MKDESFFDLENRAVDCPYPVVSSVPVCCLQEVAQDSYGPRQLMHEEIMVRAQSLNYQ
jgi:hypothetical protein